MAKKGKAPDTPALLMRLTILVTALAAALTINKACTKPALGKIPPPLKPVVKRVAEFKRGGGEEVVKITEIVGAIKNRFEDALALLQNRENKAAGKILEDVAPLLDELDDMGVDTRSLRRELSQLRSAI